MCNILRLFYPFEVLQLGSTMRTQQTIQR